MTHTAIPADSASPPLRVFVVGGTGYIGRAAVRELVRRGHDVVCFVRPGSRPDGALSGATIRFGEVTKKESLARDGLCGEAFGAVVSCLASRTGLAKDAWEIDHAANVAVLEHGMASGVRHFVLLSAICVQKPRLAFQEAKLAFERALIDSRMDYSIVRPTAFFKSLAGQVENVKRGKPFVVFGDGSLTACKPISEGDVARFLADCLEDPSKRNRILPIGGPGVPITPRRQAELLFELCDRTLRLRKVPVGVMDIIVGVLTALGRIVPRLAQKAELARIGRYYGTESMLVWDPERGRYDADATPSYGSDTLGDFYARVIKEGLAGQELGAHRVFSRADPQGERE
jgi:divinyl chlorophyllide a 8-vinyl-reductase